MYIYNNSLQEPIPITEQIWDINTTPILSISCLAYKHEKYIRQTIEGFLIQRTTFPVEILIHDDASPDNTAKIIREYEERYPQLIKPIYQSENKFSTQRGYISKIQNERTKGKYVAKCEGDDYWIDPLKLQKQVDFLESNPDYGLIHSELDHYYVKTEKYVRNHWKKCKVTNQDGDIYDNLLGNQGSMIYFCTATFRRYFLDDYEEIIKKGIPCDVSLSLLIASKSKIGYLPESTAVRNVLPFSFTQGQNITHKLKVSDLLYNVFEYFNSLRPFNPKSVYIFKQNHALDKCNYCYNFRQRYDLFEENYYKLNDDFKTPVLKIKKILFKYKIPLFLSTFILKLVRQITS